MVNYIFHGTLSMKSGKAHIPVSVRREIGNDTVGYILDAKTTLLADPDISPEDLLKSTELLVEHIKLKIRSNKK